MQGMISTFQDSAQTESSEKRTNTTSDVDGSWADNRRRERTAAHRLWPEVSTADWKGIPVLAAKQIQWVKRALMQLRVRQVSVEPRWERSGHGHQWHKQIKRSNSSREMPPVSKQGKVTQLTALQQHTAKLLGPRPAQKPLKPHWKGYCLVIFSELPPKRPFYPDKLRK